MKKAEKSNAKFYLVNTGWNGTEKRISIKETRAIIDAILNQSILKEPTAVIPFFNLRYPTEVFGVTKDVLDPRSSYKNPAVWDEKAKELASKFIANFAKFAATNEKCKKLEKSGPHI